MTANLRIDFIALFAGTSPDGDHRVCWRMGGAGPYDCTTIVTCIIPGSYHADISITVDALEIVFDGYVQPCCVPEESIVNQVPFTITYTPIIP